MLKTSSYSSRGSRPIQVSGPGLPRLMKHSGACLVSGKNSRPWHRRGIGEPTDSGFGLEGRTRRWSLTDRTGIQPTVGATADGTGDFRVRGVGRVIGLDVGSDADVECVESGVLRPGGLCRPTAVVSDGRSMVGGFRRWLR